MCIYNLAIEPPTAERLGGPTLGDHFIQVALTSTIWKSIPGFAIDKMRFPFQQNFQMYPKWFYSTKHCIIKWLCQLQTFRQQYNTTTINISSYRLHFLEILHYPWKIIPLDLEILCDSWVVDTLKYIYAMIKQRWKLLTLDLIRRGCGKSGLGGIIWTSPW